MPRATDEGFYVYGLIDPAARRQTKDDLLSVFYVGKGKNDRWRDHEKDELRDLRREMDFVTRGSKAERIRKILERGEEIPGIRLSGGYQDSKDAEFAEALTIALLNTILKQAGQDELTNGTHGNHAGFLPLTRHFKFVNTDKLLIHADAAELVLLVKGDTRELPAGGHQTLPQGLPKELEPWRSQIKVLGYGDALDEFSRPGWNADDPWNDHEARERGRRYWRIGRDTVRGWLEAPASAPRYLLLAIPSPDGTAVRYAWEIDARGEWEYHVNGDGNWYGWGVPLGRRDHDHTLLGKVLVEQRNGGEVQVLQNYEGGWRLLKV
jgi:hypothetical protein